MAGDLETADSDCGGGVEGAEVAGQRDGGHDVAALAG